MKAGGYIGTDIMAVFHELRESTPQFDYVKIEGDEFVKSPEQGFYVQSKNGTGVVAGCRMYIKSDAPYFAAADEIKGKYKNLFTLSDIEKALGPSVRDIPSIAIPGTKPTLPGKKYECDDVVVLAHYDADHTLVYLHLKKS